MGLFYLPTIPFNLIRGIIDISTNQIFMNNKTSRSEFTTIFFGYITAITLPMLFMYQEYLPEVVFGLSTLIIISAALTKGLIVRNIVAWLITLSLPLITFSWEYYNEEILGLEKEEAFFGEPVDEI
jgi:hypothetical protein